MLKEMPKVGDKVRYIGGGGSWITEGTVYEIKDVDQDGDAYFSDDNNDVEFIFTSGFDRYELIGEAPTHDTASLIANLALRVGELERQNAQQAHEINELYRADAERGVLR